MIRSTIDSRPWLPYVAPLVAFLILTMLEAQLPTVADGQPHPLWYPLTYTLKVAVVAVVVWLCRSAWRDLRPWPGGRGLAVSVALGLGVIVLWVGLERVPYPRFEDVQAARRVAFNPHVLPPLAQAAFLIVRFFGLVVLVPLIEELFYRSFLMRWILDSDFQAVPIGRVTPLAAAVTSGLFALSHPEWLPALLTGLAWAWLVWWTKSVSACVISHAVANLLLGLYVMGTGAWQLW